MKLEDGSPVPVEMTALHEAFHAVVAWAQGLRVVHMTVDERDVRVSARADCAAITTRESGTPAQNGRVALAGLIADKVIEQIMSRELGTRAVLDFGGGPQHDQDDIAYWAALEAGPGVSAAAVATIMTRWQDEVRQLMSSHADLAFKLRDRLIERRTLGEADIAAILGPSPVS